MTTFLLIRHGATDAVGHTITGRLPGVHLNELGRQQAVALPERLKTFEISALYSSPMERTLESAEPLAQALGLQVEVSQALLEVDFGAWSGLTIEELQTRDDWKMYNSFRSSSRPPGGELIGEVQIRMVTEMDRLRLQHDGQTVALFSHADPIKAALMHYLGMASDNLHRLEVSPASISEVRLDVWGVQVWGINL
ncbi:MAG: histidine phosphatase family protein [Acidobacteriota bacterium]|nr:histidine phosphatase family protein [Acidobacteriota bacterium]